MKRRALFSSLTTRVSVGLVTIVIVVIGIVIAYRANSGIPLTPAYHLNIQVPDANALTVSADVRIGGARVGEVHSLKAKRLADGSSVALLNLRLNSGLPALARDSTVILRPRSVLGAMYVDITRGKSKDVFRSGDTMPLSAAKPTPVELDQVIDMFDAPTRAASQTDLEGLGDGLAGRGPAINEALAQLPTLLRDIPAPLNNLSSPATQLDSFIANANRTAGLLAPAAQAGGPLFVGLDRTFTALASVTGSIQQSIAAAPATLSEASSDFPVIRPFLLNTQELMADFRPGIHALRGAAPDLAAAVGVGVGAFRQTPTLAKRLNPVFTTIGEFGEDPRVPLGFKRLGELASALEPTLNYLAPAQVKCNYITTFFGNAASLLSAGNSIGTWQSFILIAAPEGPNSESGPSAAPANGPTLTNHLHTNPYPYTAAPGQPAVCEGGSETYVPGKTVIGHAPR